MAEKITPAKGRPMLILHWVEGNSAEIRRKFGVRACILMFRGQGSELVF